MKFLISHFAKKSIQLVFIWISTLILIITAFIISFLQISNGWKIFIGVTIVFSVIGDLYLSIFTFFKSFKLKKDPATKDGRVRGAIASSKTLIFMHTILFIGITIYWVTTTNTTLHYIATGCLLTILCFLIFLFAVITIKIKKYSDLANIPIYNPENIAASKYEEVVAIEEKIS